MFRTFLKLNVVIMMMAALSACSNITPNTQIDTRNSLPNEHTSQNTLDWQGIYEGVTPCADCEGIKTQLQLSADGTYILNKQYLGRMEEGVIEKGSFTWNKQGQSITLKNNTLNTNPAQYQVGENQLFVLDEAGQRITGNLADRYVLNKLTNVPLENTKWQLIELYGKSVSGTSDTHYLMLISEKQQVSAKAGCNTMFGSYELKPPFQLHFKPLASTMMACANMVDEEDLAKALEMVDNFTISNNILSLNKARMAPLARFKFAP